MYQSKNISGVGIILLTMMVISGCQSQQGEIHPSEDLSDLIRVATPQSNQLVSSPLEVTGEARGTWFFEASFPIYLINEKGEKIAITPATAQEEWMTENFVPFKAEINFTARAGEQIMLVLEKDNPSGEGIPPILEVPLQVGQWEQSEAKPCRPTGCSNQVCADEDQITTCEFRPEYVCYKQATCERQQDGQCGWNMDETLKNCLEIKKGQTE